MLGGVETLKLASSQGMKEVVTTALFPPPTTTHLYSVSFFPLVSIPSFVRVARNSVMFAFLLGRGTTPRGSPGPESTSGDVDEDKGEEDAQKEGAAGDNGGVDARKMGAVGDKGGEAVRKAGAVAESGGDAERGAVEVEGERAGPGAEVEVVGDVVSRAAANEVGGSEEGGSGGFAGCGGVEGDMTPWCMLG